MTDTQIDIIYSKRFKFPLFISLSELYSCNEKKMRCTFFWYKFKLLPTLTKHGVKDPLVIGYCAGL